MAGTSRNLYEAQTYLCQSGTKQARNACKTRLKQQKSTLLRLAGQFAGNTMIIFADIARHASLHVFKKVGTDFVAAETFDVKCHDVQNTEQFVECFWCSILCAVHRLQFECVAAKNFEDGRSLEGSCVDLRVIGGGMGWFRRTERVCDGERRQGG